MICFCYFCQKMSVVSNAGNKIRDIAHNYKLKTLYLFLNSEILMDLISLSLAGSFSLNSHHGSYTVP